MEIRETATNRKEVGFAVIYTSIMAAGMFVSKTVFGYHYDSPGIVKSLLYFELVMTIFTISVYRKHYKGTAFAKIEITPSFILYTILMIAAVILYLCQGAFKDSMEVMPYLVSTTLLVAVSEELMYRGVVLSGFLKNNPPVKAILSSAALFALLHAVNMLAGVTFTGMLIQLFNTFVYGVLTACFRIRIKSILPFIIYHFLWDLMIVSPSFTSKSSLLILAVVTINLILAITMSLKIYRNSYTNPSL